MKDYCYDSLEDYLVCHPNDEISKQAIKIVATFGICDIKILEHKLKQIPESRNYYKYIKLKDD